VVVDWKIEEVFPPSLEPALPKPLAASGGGPPGRSEGLPRRQQAASQKGNFSVTRKSARIALLLLLAALMFLASGRYGSYFCVSPWAGDGPAKPAAGDASP
jgi:hypothetical protein